MKRGKSKISHKNFIYRKSKNESFTMITNPSSLAFRNKQVVSPGCVDTSYDDHSCK